MKNVQTILDLHANATPGPHHIEVLDDHSARPEGKTWLVLGLAREKYGRNAVSFGEDEGTARFVAEAFDAVPEMAARLLHVDELVAQMEDLISRDEVSGADFIEAASSLRDALSKDVPGHILEGAR